ncbi:MAG: hypothetical protein IPK17_38575 [Chloroflexi bacterium]|uniref:hypothetical protein n=1 Tax=Candidatus Flexifilum breve TaxID=3140694 RepID=UPI0031350634|nr:hypothetical protein [Chloroflexota bacterium]
MVGVVAGRIERLYWLIRQLCYDDMLIFQNEHSMEYLYLERGLPQYRIFHADTLIDVVHIRHPSRLRIIQPELARYIARLGCDPQFGVVLEGGALTPLDAKVRDLPVLKFSDEQMPKRKRARMRLG